mgnify:CR=1 FL=1
MDKGIQELLESKSKGRDGITSLLSQGVGVGLLENAYRAAKGLIDYS